MALNDLLKAIADADGPVTAKDIGATSARLGELEDDGLVQRPKRGATVRKTGGRGRPSHLWELTPKARKRVKRLVEADKNARQEKAAKKVAEVVDSVPTAA